MNSIFCVFEERKVKKGYIFLAVSLAFLAVFFILSNSPSPGGDKASPYSQELNARSIEEDIQARQFNLSIKRQLLSEQALSDQFEEEAPKEIDPLEAQPEVSDLDLGLSNPENTENEKLLGDLAEQHFVNDQYQDPENEVRSQLNRQEVLDERLRQRNQREKDQFVEDFVRTAEEQGYNVHHLEGTKVVLEPKDNQEPSVESAFEDVEVNWQ